ncbi:MAG: hypothetical protein AB7R00_02890 [Kofleriaceae bacterium]
MSLLAGCTSAFSLTSSSSLRTARPSSSPSTSSEPSTAPTSTVDGPVERPIHAGGKAPRRTEAEVEAEDRRFRAAQDDVRNRALAVRAERCTIRVGTDEPHRVLYYAASYSDTWVSYFFCDGVVVMHDATKKWQWAAFETPNVMLASNDDDRKQLEILDRTLRNMSSASPSYDDYNERRNRLRDKIAADERNYIARRYPKAAYMKRAKSFPAAKLGV